MPVPRQREEWETSAIDGKMVALLLERSRTADTAGSMAREDRSPMQEQPTAAGNGKVLPGLVYTPMPTKYVAKRGQRYIVRWNEDGERQFRSFKSYDAACGFVRDYVIPYSERTGALPPSIIAPGKGPGWVYVFRSMGPGEPVKVGFSTDPSRRLKDVSTGHPHRIELVLLVPAGRGLENRIHEFLEEYRLEGEWFRREAEAKLAKAIESAFPAVVGVASLDHRRRPKKRKVAISSELLDGGV